MVKEGAHLHRGKAEWLLALAIARSSERLRHRTVAYCYRAAAAPARPAEAGWAGEGSRASQERKLEERALDRTS